jgi:nucleoside-diphosphate-sugar epimerase
MISVITGATGFLGQHLARQLLAQGKPVRVVARSADRAQPLAALGAELVEAEITDAGRLARAFDGAGVVYHLAGRLFEPGTPAHTYRETHVEGTRLVIERCRHAGVRRLVHCSTTGVLGITGAQPAGEQAPCAPTNAYERTKLEAELLVREAIDRGLDAAIVRPGLVYGPGDLHLLGFFRSIERGVFRPIGAKPVWLHPVYIDDMTRAFRLCGSLKAAAGQCFHIAGEAPVTIAELAAAIARSLGRPAPRGHIPMPLARVVAAAGDRLPARLRQRAPLTSSRLDFLTHSRVYDGEKAARSLDFKAEICLGEGLRRTVAWYREYKYLTP